MSIPQRVETIEKIKRLDTLLEYATMHIRLRRRRQAARRSVATEPRSVRMRSSDEAVTAQDRIASKASSVRTEARKLKADATTELYVVKRKIEARNVE